VSDRGRFQGPGGDTQPAGRGFDPRAIRVASAGTQPTPGSETIVIAPADAPDGGRTVIVDGAPVRIRLDRLDETHAVFIEEVGGAETRTRLLLLPLERHAGRSDGGLRRGVVVDGWWVDVEIESERHASLRERARRGGETTAAGGPTQVRAIIPGRIVSISILPGDPVAAGQQLLVVEAMKMQNELRAPRDGIVSSVAVAVGATIEVGDLMLVLE
jgi:multidrug resistance efflux pump